MKFHTEVQCYLDMDFQKDVKPYISERAKNIVQMNYFQEFWFHGQNQAKDYLLDQNHLSVYKSNLQRNFDLCVNDHHHRFYELKRDFRAGIYN